VTSGAPAAEPASVGFIGLGHMGYAMAANLARRGHTVCAWDRDTGARARFAAEFSMPAPANLGELAAADIVITMLPTGAVVREVLEGGGAVSLVNTLRPGSIVIDTTSSVPDGTKALGAALAARGVAMIDAPVSGARKGALDGTLVFMIGGDDEAALVRATPALAAMGTRLIRTGPLGSGNAMKALNNFVSAAGFAAACEALVIGGQFGLDPAVMTEVLNLSTGRNFSTEVSLPRIVARNFKGTFTLGLFTKDTRIAAEMADAAGVTAPISHLVYARMAEAVEKLGGDGDHTTAQLHWETQVGPSRK
jgi:3-hydroxyisobutyrate dehydrogenase